MKLQSIWRYPVKSLQGEPLQEAFADERGLSGDRHFALVDQNGKLGSGKSTTRFQRIDKLLSLNATSRDGTVFIGFPGGEAHDVASEELPDILSSYLGHTVQVAPEDQVPHFDDGPVHILLTSELKRLQALLADTLIDARRFRPNLVLDCPDHMTSEELIGSVLTIGETQLKVTHHTERCVMVTMGQEDLLKNPYILRKVSQDFDLNFGVYASILKPGRIRISQSVEVSTQDPNHSQYGFGL